MQDVSGFSRTRVNIYGTLRHMAIGHGVEKPTLSQDELYHNKKDHHTGQSDQALCFRIFKITCYISSEQGSC